jgi:hypothetical protein
MATIVSAEEARVAWILTPSNSPDELPAWGRLYDAVVPRPADGPGSWDRQQAEDAYRAQVEAAKNPYSAAPADGAS